MAKDVGKIREEVQDTNFLTVMANAIKTAENNPRNLGVLSVKTSDPNSVLNQSVSNNYNRWISGKTPAPWIKNKPEKFVDFMKERWAPNNVKNDPNNLNKNWAPNVKSAIKKQVGEEKYKNFSVLDLVQALNPLKEESAYADEVPMNSDLPEGFVLDNSNNSELPEGFVLDNGSDTPVDPAEQRIQGRKSAIADLTANPITMQHPLGAALRTLGGASELYQGIPASIALDLQKGNPQDIIDNLGKVVTGQRPAQYGDVFKGSGLPSWLSNTLGVGTDVALSPGGAEAGVGLGKSAVNIAKESGNIAKSVGKVVTSGLHNEEFIRGAAKNLKNFTDGMSKSLHDIYGSFYNEHNLSNIPLNSSKVDEILLTHNIPTSIIKSIDENIGKVDTVGKAHEARQLIDSSISKGSYNDYKGDFNPTQAKINVRSDLKKLMRETTRPVNPEATQLLEELDKHASEHIYPRIDKFEGMLGNSQLAKNYPNTKSIYSLMKGGLAKTSDLDVMLDTPAQIKKLGKYLDTPEFNKDLEKTLKESQSLGKKLKEFQGREKAKQILGTGIKDTAIGSALIKLFGF